MTSDLRVRPRQPSRPAPDRTPHPRMRARRVEVARDAGRRRLRRLNVVLALVCAVVWGLVVLRSPLVDVDRVQVTGATRTEPDVVAATSDIEAGDMMVGADLARAEEAVAALPWVDEVRATRMWPGTVRIVVTERDPLAVVAHPDGWAVVDAEGRVLDVVADQPGGLVVDDRTEAAPGGRVAPALRSLLRTLVRLPEGTASDVVSAASSEHGHQVTLATGEQIVLGDATDLDLKLTAARAVADDAGPEDGCRIDVRVPTAPVLTLDGSCA